MLLNIVLYISTAVICNKTYLNVIFFQFVQQFCYFFYNTFIETILRLVDEGCVTSFLGNLRRYIIDIDKYFNYYLIVYHWNNYTPP